MSKVLKVAATVVGAAALIIATGGAASFGIAGALSTTLIGTSLTAGTLFTISAGLSIGSSLLAKRPKAPSVNGANLDRLNSTIDLRTPRKIVWGNTAGANDVRDQEYTDNQTYLHRFIVVASHKVHQIYEIWFDDEKAWDSTSGVASKFSGYLTVTPITEGAAGNAINISARMGTTRRYTGCAYVYLRFKLTGNTKKTESPFAQSVPTRVTIRTRGALVYDPRKDSTVPGGSGSHRADDQSTWEWDDDAARNPALQMLWWMLGWRINGKLAVGGGIPPARIDLESFITAANLCDEDVALAAGGTEPRYRSDGVVSEGDSPTVIMDALKAAMNADLDDVGGKLRVFVFHNDLGTPAADFTDDDILGSFEYRASPALDESFNVVRGTYTDPRDQSLYQQIDYPQVELDSRDGIDRIDTFPLALVQSASQAQRLAKQRLQRMQYGGVFTATGQATWWKVQKNSVVRLTFAPRGWVNKLFRVAELEHRVDGTVPITLREENSQIYAWDADESPPVEPVDGSGYDPGLNPIIQDIDAGLVVVVPPPAQTVFADFTGTPLAGQYPRTLKPQVTRGTADIRTSDSVTYAITPSDGISASINNIAADPAKGWITVTDGGSGVIALTVTVNGVPLGPYSIVFNRVTFDPPSAGGPGAKSASDNSYPTINWTTDAPIAGPMTVTVDSGEDIACTFPAEYNVVDTTNASARLRGKWQTSPAGADTWTDIATAINGSTSTWIAADFSGDPGSGTFNQTATGLSAGDYDVRFVGALDNVTGTPDLTIFEGTARVIVS